MAPKKSQKAKAEEQAEDAGVEVQPAPAKDKSKVPGGKAGGAASGELSITAHISQALEAAQHYSQIYLCYSLLSLSTQQDGGPYWCLLAIPIC